MIISITICIVSFFLLTMMLRSRRVSVGLPVAYLFILLFLHVPGAVAHVLGENYLAETEATEIGIWFTSIGAFCFVIGVWISRFHLVEINNKEPKYDSRFAVFCLLAGFSFTYGLKFATTSPSIGAVIEKGGGIWVLGVFIGLAAAVRTRKVSLVFFWVLAMAIYPTLVLLLGGFLSFGSTPIFIILAALFIQTKSSWRANAGL